MILDSALLVASLAQSRSTFLGFEGDYVVFLAGAVIGLLGSSLATFLSNQLRKRRLRKAIRGEIRMMANDIHSFAGSVSRKEPAGVTVPPDIFILSAYEANAADIGLLSADEIREVTEFYGRLQNLKRRLANLEQSGEREELEKRLIQRDLILLNNAKNDALSEIENKLLFVPLSEGSEYSDVELPEVDLGSLVDQDE